MQLNVTGRKFAFLTNNNPSNTCKLNYSMEQSRTYVYTVYTHPDKTAVVSTDGLEGTAVEESFTPALARTSIVGNGGCWISSASEHAAMDEQWGYLH